MAKVLFGLGVADIRGKEGGSVWSRNKGGAYVRTKVTPLNPNTNFQSTARSRLAQFSQGWRGLTEAQREGWNDAVDLYRTTNVFGNEITPTGKNLYTRLNAVLLSVGESALEEAPMPEEVPGITSLSITFNETSGNIELTFEPGPVPANTAWQVWATAPQSAGRSFVKSQYRQIGTLTSGTESGEDIQSLYTARFGEVVPVGAKVFIKLVPVNTNTGQKGTGRQANAIQTVEPA